MLPWRSRAEQTAHSGWCAIEAKTRDVIRLELPSRRVDGRSDDGPGQTDEAREDRFLGRSRCGGAGGGSVAGG